MNEQLESIYRAQARAVRATLIRLLGDFDSAEDALHEAFVAAAAQWPNEGVPGNPYAWLVSVGRFKTIDRRRKEGRALPAAEPPPEAQPIEDDELRLIFTCCHPALGKDAQVALTLREVCGLTTEAIARAYVVSAPTIAQRIVRAKHKITADALPYEVPERSEWPRRVESVLQVVYLIFNDGAHEEAIRLARLVASLLNEPEARGLLALLLLHDARKKTRVGAEGNLILLQQQDRSLWDAAVIAEASTLIAQSMHRAGPYTLQAAIAEVHATAAQFSQTNWERILFLYDHLCELEPTPIYALNRAVARSMRDGPAAAEVEIAQLLEVLPNYPYAHAALADMQRQQKRFAEARRAYERALALTTQEGERRFLQGRIAECEAG